MESLTIKEDIGRGMLLYIRHSIVYSSVDIHQFVNNVNEAQIVSIDLDVGSLLFCALYRSPNSDAKSINELFKKIGQGNFSHIIITGYMNFPGIDRKNYGSVKYDEKNKNNQFLEAIRDGYLYQHVESATRDRGSNEPSILHLFFTNDEDIISSVSYNSPIGKSDHCVLMVEYDCKLDENNWCKYRYNYERGNYSKMHHLDINWEKLFSSMAGDVNEYWEKFLSIFKEAQENNIPKKQSK